MILKVLMLADGRAVHTVRFQKELARQGVEIVLASLERGPTVDIPLKRLSVSNSLSYFFANRQIKDLVRKMNPDLINPHFASGYGFSVAISRVWKRKPVALHCLGSDILISPKKSIAHKRKVTLALDRADTIFCDSTFIAEQITTLAPSAETNIIPWGVEDEILNLFEKRKKHHIDADRPVRVLIPRPHNKIYNNLFIYESLKNLLEKKRLNLTFPAWGDDLDEFKKATKKERLDGSISLYPFRDRREYIDSLADFDIFLSAALSDSSPASLIEAMAAGLYPVVADIPGIGDWAGHGDAALFDPRDGNTLRAAFEKILDPSFDIKSTLEKNHRLARQKGRFPDNIEKTVKIMKSMVANGP